MNAGARPCACNCFHFLNIWKSMNSIFYIQLLLSLSYWCCLIKCDWKGCCPFVNSHSYRNSLLSRRRAVGGKRGGERAAAVQNLVFLLFYFTAAPLGTFVGTHTAVCLSCSTILPLRGRELLRGVGLHLVAFLSSCFFCAAL